MEFVDTHCHIQFDNYQPNEDKLLARAAQNGVTRVICVGTTLKDSERGATLAATKRTVWASAGTHPHAANDFLADANNFKKLKKIASRPRIVAIGEIGLDYHRQVSEKADQELALRGQIEVALGLGLPIIFHVRDAWNDFWRIFDSYKTLFGVVHSFSSDTGHLVEILSRDLYVGLNGIMTFTKDHNQLEAAKAVPLNRLLLETDAPFLTPAPFRNEICEPKHVLQVAEFLSQLREEPIETLAKETSTNAEKLFKLSKGSDA